jgi:symplekin
LIMFSPVIRQELAVQWMYEEFRTDLCNPKSEAYQPKYFLWLLKLVTSALPNLRNDDRSLSKLLLDVPELNAEVIELLKADMERRPERYKVTMLTLHDLTLFRPPIRQHCLDVLLEYCTVQDKNKRAFAILDVRKWVPDHAISPIIEEFSIKTLRQLLDKPSAASKQDQSKADSAVETKAVAMDVSERVNEQSDGEVPSSEELWDEEIVVPHLELFFALCSKKPELLNS